MALNILVFALTALVPLVTGFAWYHKAAFGKPWMRANRFVESDLRGVNRAMILILAYVLSIMLSLALANMVIHQMHIGSLVAKEPGLKVPGSELSIYVKGIYARFGGKFRTFGHGVFHGSIAGLFVAMPIIGIIALFERRPFRYVAIHTGYWIVTLALMGGLLCQFLKLG